MGRFFFLAIHFQFCNYAVMSDEQSSQSEEPTVYEIEDDGSTLEEVLAEATEWAEAQE